MFSFILCRRDRNALQLSGFFSTAWLIRAIVAILPLCFCNLSGAGIASFEGDIQLIEPPPFATWSNLEDDEFAKLFAERQSVLLQEDLHLDVYIAGVVDKSQDLTPIDITGDTVNSYLLHSDPLRNGMPPRDYQGSITFVEEILGVMVTARSLDRSDSLLGAIGTTYVPRNIFSGFEGPGFPAQGTQINDHLELMPDLRTISFHFKTTSMLDQIRIVTRAVGAAPGFQVPEPTFCLTGLFLPLIFYRKARTRL